MPGTNGDATFAASTSAPDSQVVNRTTSTTGLSTDINPSSFGQNIKITARSRRGPRQRTVPQRRRPDRHESGAPSGITVFSFQYLLPGTHSLTAVYPGDVHYEGSSGGPVSQVVTR